MGKKVIKSRIEIIFRAGLLGQSLVFFVVHLSTNVRLILLLPIDVN